MSHSWPFEEPKDMPVFTTAEVVSGEDWIFFVTHDEEDGYWQFHGSGDSEQAQMVSFAKIFSIEPKLAELADLPLGWCAWRDSANDPWQRKPNSRTIK